jgi:hypothetical protein
MKIFSNFKHFEMIFKMKIFQTVKIMLIYFNISILQFSHIVENLLTYSFSRRYFSLLEIISRLFSENLNRFSNIYSIHWLNNQDSKLETKHDWKHVTSRHKMIKAWLDHTSLYSSSICHYYHAHSPLSQIA